MISFDDSIRSYERWLRDQLGAELVEADLARKHDRMRESAFAFLRATYWRWAEIIPSVCPDVASAPKGRLARCALSAFDVFHRKWQDGYRPRPRDLTPAVLLASQEIGYRPRSVFTRDGGGPLLRWVKTTGG